MSIGEAYIYFLNILEKNSTNNNLNVDKPRFIEWFNFTLKKYQEYALQKRNDDSIREMLPFLKSSSLVRKNHGVEYDLYTRPSDFFGFANLSIEATSGACKAKDFLLSEVKPENVHILNVDVNYKPSFKARESYYHLMDDSVAIYHLGDFNITKADMKYYRQIPEVDIEGYVTINNTASTNVDPVTDDKTTVKILQKMAVYFASAEGDVQKFQAEQINFSK